jgi:hypothetical protein
VPLRINIPLPGPFSYSVRSPSLTRAVRDIGRAGQAIARADQRRRASERARPREFQRPLPPLRQPRMPRTRPSRIETAPATATWAGVLVLALIFALLVVASLV